MAQRGDERLLLIDFGLAKDVSKPTFYMCGSLAFLAPEPEPETAEGGSYYSAGSSYYSSSGGYYDSEASAEEATAEPTPALSLPGGVPL